MASDASGATAYAKVMDAIRAGVFAPGDRLREADVSARLGLSRTPVREALRRLEAEAIVVHRPRIGAVIRRLDQAEIVELYEMRIVLERTAAELAARHGLDAEFDTLDALNDRISTETENPAHAAAINADFHGMLYRAGRNRFLLEAARALNNALLLLGPTTYTDAERVSTVARQHRDIVDALRAGDEEAAGASAEAHLQTSLRARLQALIKT